MRYSESRHRDLLKSEEFSSNGPLIILGTRLDERRTNDCADELSTLHATMRFFA
jgi:hypothetical protein